MTEALGRTQAIARELVERTETRRLEFYQPYPFQQRFHAARDMNGNMAMQRLLMAGNQVGKTNCGASETAMHATGEYPAVWVGHRIGKPKKIWCGGANNDKVRDVCQAKLLGNPEDPEDFGKGTIPKDKIIKTTRKPGIPNALESVLVRHKSGANVSIVFKSYDADINDWMSESVDVVWLDEEPDQLVYSQALARTISTGGIIYMTFTPEHGVTAVVNEFMNNIKPGQALFRAGWDDAPHLTPEVQAQLATAFPAHEREMRKKGDPVFGSGLIFPVSDDSIRCDPFPIPRYWPRINGLDFGGWDHPTACAHMAWNRDTNEVFIYAVYKQRQELPSVHVAAIKRQGAWIPTAWPHDGNQKDKGSGVQLAKQYRKEGLTMLPQHFTNPPDPSGKENFAVEPGLNEMLGRMEADSLKVFATCEPWFAEKATYHRKDNMIVKTNDDLMSATRYGIQSLRFAKTQSVTPMPAIAAGMDVDPLEHSYV